MAISYDNRKKSYESMDDSQKQQYNDILKSKGDDYIGNQYMKQYNESVQPQTSDTPQSDSNSSNFNNQNGTNGQNTANNQTPAITKTENQTYGKTQFDKEEKLDTSMFNQAPGKVTVKEGTAAQTGRPDYQLESDARLDEMKKNLDQYFQDSPRMFNDRETFNRVFEYNNRESEAQRQVLDSYRKRKQDMDRASQFTSGESVYSGMNKGEITTDQLNYIKDYNPEAYRKWQEIQEGEIKKRIVNDITPPLLEDLAAQFNTMMEKLKIEPQDALDIEGIWKEYMESTGAMQTLQDANDTVKQIEYWNNKKVAIANRDASSTGGTVSDALAAARMQKALAPCNEALQGLQYQYQDYANLYNQKLATANQAAQVRQAQAQENQRVWNQRLTALGFAMEAVNYRTPEQQMQLKLQAQQAQNEMDLLQQSRLNDLNLYNAYATTKLQNQLQSELTDLNVDDPKQLRANLNNILSQYYSQYGDIIQRSQAQAVDDILKYAKDKNISVAQAITDNFITPLQNKKEYKQKVAESYGLNKYQQQYSYTIDEEGNVVIKASGFGQIPDSAFATRASRQEAYGDVYEQSLDWESYIMNLSECIKDGSYGGQCGAFVNDVLVAGDNNKVFGDSLQDKKNAINVSKEEGPQVGYAAVFDLGFTSSDGENHGHVGIVSSVNNDGSIDVLESNGKSDEKIHVKRYSKAAVDQMVMGYYKPANYDTSRDLDNSDMKQVSGLQKKFGDSATWNQNGYIESLDKDFEIYLEKGKAAITDSQRKALKEDYGIDEKDFREMAQIYAKTGLKKKGVTEAERALKSALQLQDMLDSGKTLGVKDNPQKGLFDRAINQWIPRTDAGEAKAQYNTLMSQLKLEELFAAKNNGASFGAMSDAEWQVLGDASTNLKWNSSGATFEKNLNDLIAELANVVSSGGGTLPKGVYNLDI